MSFANADLQIPKELPQEFLRQVVLVVRVPDSLCKQQCLNVPDDLGQGPLQVKVSWRAVSTTGIHQ